MKHVKLYEEFVTEGAIVDREVTMAAGDGAALGKYGILPTKRTGAKPYWSEGFDYDVDAMSTFPNDKEGTEVRDKDAYTDEVLEYAAEQASNIAGVKLKVKNGGLYSNKVKGIEMSFDFKGGKWIGLRKEGAMERGGVMDLYEFIEQFVALSTRLQKR